MRWGVSCLVIFVISGAVLIRFIPVLQLTASHIILRPTPSCSTFNSPPRYLALILDENNNQVFYVTTTMGVENTDPHMKEAAPFYIISASIRSPKHYRIVSGKVKFQSSSIPGVKKSPFNLKKGHCVRAAGPTTADPLLVAFYSLNGTETILEDSGYIAKKDLEELHSGWLRVSNCKTELTRLLCDCKTGYVSSAYVWLTEYEHIFLRVEETTIKKAQKSSQHATTDTLVQSEGRDSDEKEEEHCIPLKKGLEMQESNKSYKHDTDESNEGN